MATQLNITIEVIAAYRGWVNAEAIADRSSQVVMHGKPGSKEDRKAVRLAHSKFIKAIQLAGNNGDWDAEKIIAKLYN